MKILIYIFIFLLNIILLFPSDYDNCIRTKILNKNHQKLYSANILYSIDNKRNYHPNLKHQKIFLHVFKYPNFNEINQLNSLNIDIDLETYVPKIGNHRFGIFQAVIPIDSLNSLLSLDFIKKIENAESLLYPQNNSALSSIKADTVHFMSFTGDSIKLAILDSGFDMGYQGNEINNQIFALDYSNYPDSIDNYVYNSVSGHGTHVVGCAMATGFHSKTNKINGGGAYTAPAIDANLLFLKIGKDGTAQSNDVATQKAIVDAVSIYKTDLISLSYGNFSDYQDGSSALEHTIDWAVGQGVPVFCAAGNEQKSKTHYSIEVPSGEWSKFVEFNLFNIKNILLNFIWEKYNDDDNIEIELFNQSLKKINNFYQYSKTQSERGFYASILSIELPNTITSAKFYLKIKNKSINKRLFHIYSNQEHNLNFINPDSNYTTLKPSNADSAFSVGAYTTRNKWISYDNTHINRTSKIGGISYFSSIGPRIDGYQKPDILAPGENIISLRDTDVNLTPNSYWIDNDGVNGGKVDYIISSGTSMSAPICAGAASLILSRVPDASPFQIYSALRSGAYRDTFTTKKINFKSGYGKLNLPKSINDNILPNIITTNKVDKSICGNNPFHLKFTSNCIFDSSNYFIVQLSDSNYSFDNPYELIKVKSTKTDSILIQIPTYEVNDGFYKIRVISTNPTVYGSAAQSYLKYTNMESIKINGKNIVCPHIDYIYIGETIENVNNKWSIINGKIIDSTDAMIKVRWNSNEQKGLLILHAKHLLNDCESSDTLSIRIKPSISPFISGVDIVCVDSVYAYITAVKPNETAFWEVIGGEIIDSTKNHIDVKWKKDSELFNIILTVDDDTCQVSIEKKIVNLFANKNQIKGKTVVYQNCLYEYSLNSNMRVKNYYWLNGGIMIDSNNNSISIRWFRKNNCSIDVYRKAEYCGFTNNYPILVKDTFGISIIGDEEVCKGDTMLYKISNYQFAEYDIKITNGVILHREDSLLTVLFKNKGYAQLIITKSINEFQYYAEKIKIIHIFDKQKATIDSVLSFCVNDIVYKLVEGKPEGGKYEGVGIEDNFFNPLKAGAGIHKILYLYPPASNCQDTAYSEIIVNPAHDSPKLNYTGVYLIAQGKGVSYNWYLDSILIIEDSSPKLYPEKNGWYSVTSIGENQCESKLSNSIFVEVTSISERPEFPKIYPQPINNKLFIENEYALETKLTIYDLSGKQLFYYKYFSKMINIDFSVYRNGTFFLKLEYESNIYVYKLVK